MSKVTALSKVVKGSGLSTLQKAMSGNYLTAETRNQPNAKRLIDGAIQRASVQQDTDKLDYWLNEKKCGVSVRPHQGISSSGSGCMLMDPSMAYGMH